MGPEIAEGLCGAMRAKRERSAAVEPMIIQHSQIDNRAMVCYPEKGLRGPTRFQRKRLKRLVAADSVAAAEISGDGSASCEPIITKSSQGDNCETPVIA